MTAGFDLWMLGAEAGSVMMLRTARIAAGGSAGAAEAELMVTEKIRAAIELQTRLMSGTLGVTALGATQGTLKHYRRKVAANNRRLSRPVDDRRT
ncbi:hypothetical protein D9601_17585 [Sphingomonas sp. MA1305]|uniref:hypothetical protein n=1 Tax=Sphingomonas sp. MA1305 TaxID=2479204 RepID=UPI001E2ADBFC|nr:hypothetical protein [Sphingomonas sp. MA1305]MBI0477162.1 hypothetical protein [Sphingomonas sp. MA1305]